jgi:hypothetical protein
VVQFSEATSSGPIPTKENQNCIHFDSLARIGCESDQQSDQIDSLDVQITKKGIVFIWSDNEEKKASCKEVYHMFIPDQVLVF